MKNKNIPNFNAPLGFKEILHDFAKVVLKFQPKDLIEFGADYFESLNEVKIEFFFLKSIKIQREDC